MLPAKKDIRWDYARQLGVKYAVTKAAPELSGLSDPSDLSSLERVCENFAADGFTLYALEGDEFDMSRIKLGLDGRDEDIEKYCKMLTNMGKCGLKLLCYNFMAGIGWYRTHESIPERGGALASGFDIEKSERKKTIITHERMWENYEYFIKSVMPYAEKAGVKMGLHPDDPPISELCGYSRIIKSADDYRRAMSLSSSPSHGITFCQATFGIMGENVPKLMEEFGERIFFLHFRDAKGNREHFRETFHDNGMTDMALLMRNAHKFCPECLLRPDHTPSMAGENNAEVGYTALGNIFAVGYIKGIADAEGIPLFDDRSNGEK